MGFLPLLYQHLHYHLYHQKYYHHPMEYHLQHTMDHYPNELKLYHEYEY